FNGVGVEQGLRVADGGRTCSNGRVGILRKQLSNRVDLRRVDQRLVALDIDDYGVVAPAHLLGDLGQAVGSGSVIGASQRGIETVRQGGRLDGGVVGGDDDARGL